MFDQSVVFLLLLISLFLSVALVSGNNLSSCVATAVGAKIISRRFAAILGACGFALGLVTLGSRMIFSSRVLLPNDPSTLLVSEILLGTVLVFIVGNILRVPLSITLSLVGLLVGTSVAHGLALDLPFLIYVLLVWIIAPIVSVIMAFYGTRAATKSTVTDPFSRARTFKLLIVVTSFLAAFATGSNTLALLTAVSGYGEVQILVSIVAVFFGCFFLSAGQIRRVGVELFMLRYSSALASLSTSAFLMGFASVLGIPLSSTQTLSASVFGAGISYKQKFISAKPFLIVIAGWIIAPLLSVAIGLLI